MATKVFFTCGTHTFSLNEIYFWSQPSNMGVVVLAKWKAQTMKTHLTSDSFLFSKKVSQKNVKFANRADYAPR